MYVNKKAEQKYFYSAFGNLVFAYSLNTNLNKLSNENATLLL